MEMTGTYDLRLVALSILVAVIASYAALDLAGRVTASKGGARRVWLASGAVAMGAGIWSMHFIGMLAFSVPMPMTYSAPTVALSLLVAIAASGLALFIVSRRTMGRPQLVSGGLFLGAGILGMHYIGMAGMRMQAAVSYDPLLVGLSAVIAFGASLAALWLAYQLRRESGPGGRWLRLKAASALVMGGAISGMHYTGMAAASFAPTRDVLKAPPGAAETGTSILAAAVGAATLAILGVAIFTSVLNRRFLAQAAALEASEQRYESLFEENPDAVFSFDREGRFTSVNPAVERITGYPADEILGQTSGRLLAPEDLERAAEHFMKTLRGEPRSYETAVISRDGSRVPVAVTNIPIVLEGEVVGVYGIAKDITQRQRAEEALRESEIRTRAIVDTAQDAIITMSSDGVIRSFNPGAERTFGYGAEEVVGEPLRMLMPERFHGSHEAGFRRYLSGGEARVVGKGPVELAGRRKSGEEFPLELSLGEAHLGDERVFTGVIRDITARKRAEKTIRESEQRFKQLFEQSVDTLLVHDSRGRIVDCNEEACRSLGYTRDEMLSLRVGDFATNLVARDERWKQEESTLWERALSGEPGRIAGVHRGMHRRRDGTTFPVEVHVGSVDYGGERMLFASARDITERLEAERELREAEERFRSAFESAAIGMALTDPGSGRYLRVNRALCEMFGRSEEEMLATNFRDVTCPEDRDLTMDYERRVMAGELDSYQHEKRYLHGDGHLVWAQTNISVVRDSEGKPLHFVAQIQDITERRRAEESLRRSEANLAASQERAHLGSWEWDTATGGLLWSDEHYRIFGHAPQSFEPDYDTHYLGAIHPEDRDLVCKAIDESFEGKPYNLDYRIVRTDGETRHVQSSGEVLFDESGAPIGMSGTVQDITERKRAERQVFESEERYRLVSRATNEVIWDNDFESGTQHWDGAIEAMFGYSADEVGESGAWWERRIHPDDRENVLSSLQEALDGGGESWSCEYRLRRADGEYATVADRGYVVRDAGGRPVRMLGSMMDVTERKRAEEAQRQSEERFRGLADATFEGIAILERGWVLETNRAFADLFGYEQREILGKRVFDFVAPESRDLARRNIESGLEEPYEAVAISRDGARFDVEIRGKTSIYRDREVRVSAVRDITGRKQSERRLREAEERFRTLVEQMPAVTYRQATGTVDGLPSGAITYVSPQVEDQTGYPSQAFLEDPELWLKIIHPEDREYVLAEDARTEECGETFEVEYRIICRDERVVWIRDEAVLIRDESGQPLYWQGFQV
ncbi:MAG TPA: PAS domain S-box protein, partial [Rubrobacteraceae bacterium]|nr:PAS domain S-box protein [Rubrobacteraceae bacterium]